MSGLDELMIVNPGSPGGGAVFLGADGTLYQVEPDRVAGAELGDLSAFEVGRFFLGDDGMLYEVVKR